LALRLQGDAANPLCWPVTSLADGARHSGENGIFDGGYMEQSSLNLKRIADTPRIYVASLADYNACRLVSSGRLSQAIAHPSFWQPVQGLSRMGSRPVYRGGSESRRVKAPRRRTSSGMCCPRRTASRSGRRRRGCCSRRGGGRGRPGGSGCCRRWSGRRRATASWTRHRAG